MVTAQSAVSQAQSAGQGLGEYFILTNAAWYFNTPETEKLFPNASSSLFTH
jgi:hypothetical protein